MIGHSCPVIVLDDAKEELWEISHGLGLCGLPIMPHLIIDGALERVPEAPHEGVRILFTDLHILGPTQNKPAQYVSALIKFIEKLIHPSTYLIVFWSSFPEDAAEAWDILKSRIKEELVPFAYWVLSKEDVKAMSHEDPSIAAKATEKVKVDILSLYDEFPQLKSFMQWESCVSRAASATSNELIEKLGKGGVPFTSKDAVKATLKRMSQEALGLPHAPNAPTKGVYQALLPIAEDWLNKEAENGALDDFLDLKNREMTPLPTGKQGEVKLSSLLNDFFIHTEQLGLQLSDRGAVIRLSQDFLEDVNLGLVQEIGLAEKNGDWQEAICMEFLLNFFQKSPEEKEESKSKLDANNVFVVELSADCDYAQDKARSHRFLLALFVPCSDLKSFYSNSKKVYANEAIYSTPDITLNGIEGRLLISCRIFLTRPYKGSVRGTAVTRIRQEVLSEIAHHYATHMRRPGKIAFF